MWVLLKAAQVALGGSKEEISMSKSIKHANIFASLGWACETAIESAAVR
jgi:hypothetical protein